MTVLIDTSDVAMDPAHAITTTEAQFFTGIYEGIVTYDPQTLEPLPAIASSWDISKDKLRYTFHLNPNAKFSDGTPIKAQDFYDSWMRLILPQTNADYASLLDIVQGVRDYRLGKIKDKKTVKITVINDTTLQVDLVRPGAHFLNILCHHSFIPYTLNKQGDPKFSGAFYPVKQDYGYDLIKNNYYWDKANVALDKIKLKVVDDPSEKTDMFNKNQAQWVADGFDFNGVSWRPAIVYNSLFATSYFYFQESNEVYKNPKVRLGLIQLLPWQEIRKNQYYQTETLVPAFQSYPKVEGSAHTDIEKGMANLKEAGYPEGKGLPTIKILISQSDELNRIALLMKNTWEEKLKVTVDIEQTPYNQYYRALDEDSYTLGSISWIGDFADPLTFLQMWTSNSNLNDSQYSNKAYDDIVEQSSGEPRPDRFKTQAEAEKILLDSGIILPLGNSAVFNLIDTNYIKGWYANPLDIHPFKYLDYGEGLIIPGLAFIDSRNTLNPLVNLIPEQHSSHS